MDLRNALVSFLSVKFNFKWKDLAGLNGHSFVSIDMGGGVTLLKIWIKKIIQMLLEMFVIWWEEERWKDATFGIY